MPELTAERLRELLHYDKETGVFTRRTTKGRFKAGEVAGSHDRHRYMVHNFNGKLHRAHRLVWLYVYGEWPRNDIDHINGVRDDNRLANLRDVPRGVNLQNKKAASSNSLSGLLGASPDRKWKGKWRARIQADGKKHLIGYFDTPEEAHEAYLKAKRQLHEGCTI